MLCCLSVSEVIFAILRSFSAYADQPQRSPNPISSWAYAKRTARQLDPNSRKNIQIPVPKSCWSISLFKKPKIMWALSEHMIGL